MKIAVIGHGMVGHKFLEQLHELGVADAEVTVFCEEPRAAYDRVHLSEFFAGKTAEDLVAGRARLLRAQRLHAAPGG
jgi:nitrite reductase (NADH) large subunit